MADKIKTKTINQTTTFDAGPEVVYGALMDSKKHSEFTGSKAEISKEVGGEISAYDGYIEGKNLELQENKKIVQSWRANDWPEGHWTRVTFSLIRKGKKTQLKFKHEGVPAEFYEDIEKGWIDYYWKPMKEIFTNEK